MTSYHHHQRRLRAWRARIVVIGLLSILGVVFFRAQVYRASEWQLQSESNRLRPLDLPAPRGTIRDRSGRAVADNVPGYSISILSASPDSMRSTLDRMREHLDIDPARLERVVEQVEAGSARPILVSIDASFEAVAALEERRSAFPRVLIETRPKRRYPAREVGAHIVGSVGEINQDELESPEFEGAQPGLIVGRSGIEWQYESLLQGTAGVRYVEVDASGRIVGSFRGFRRVEEEPGQDLDLHLDLDLMEWIHQIFPEGMSGAVVALDVRTGGILALYSAPSYDPNVFAGVVDQADWRRLNEDPESPLFNRAITAKYPPGSPMKLVTALVALETGVIGPDDRMPVACTGGFYYGGRRWGCWDEDGHGSLDLADAIKASCNVYFYQVGLRIGLNRMLDRVNDMGFGGRCGVDLPSEAMGTYPEGPEYWVRRHGYSPREGEVLNLAIGQGPIEQTPLMVAQYFLAIARDGSAPAPSLFRDAPRRVGFRLDIPEENLAVVREGLRRVTQQGGTAYLSSLEHFDLLGKTGTAQSVEGRENHAWFGAIAGPRGGPPEIVLVALVEFGGGGSAVAAPLVAKAADFYLRGEHGIPRDTIQTLREYFQVGRNTAWALPQPAER